MEYLQEESKKRFSCGGFDIDADSTVHKLHIHCNAAEILAETSDSLLIYADIEYFQEATQRVECDDWREYGGRIYTQYLLKYDLSKKEYKIGEINDNRKSDD